MAISDQIQMLISAFTFGLLVQATVAASFLYINGHGRTIFKDHRRLALTLFLTFVALWGSVDFLNFAIPSTNSNACQVTILASTFFDQAARITIGGFLLWSVGHIKKTPVESSGLCALMGIRTVAGVIFVAYARPQFIPVCVVRSDLLAASVAVMVLDMIVIGIVTIRTYTLGLWNVVSEVRSSTKKEQNKALIYCTGALSLWTLTSSAMMVGMSSIVLLLRTALPAMGLMVLVSILKIYTGALVLPRDDDSRTPEARSPFVAPPNPSVNSFGDDDGSPVRDTGYNRTANLFVVNPSNTPHDSSVMTYLEDVKAEDENYTGYRSTGTRSVKAEEVNAMVSKNLASNRASSGVFQSLSAATLEAIGSAAFFAAPREAPTPSPQNKVDQTQELPIIAISHSETRQKRARFGWSKKWAEKSVHKIIISNPVVDNAETFSIQPFANVRTVDLVTAVSNERTRREDSNMRQLVAKRPAPPPPTTSEIRRKSLSTRRKEVAQGRPVSLTLAASEKATDEAKLSVTVNASSTSASLSPGRDDVRRRSPRAVKDLEGNIEKAYFLTSRPDTDIRTERETAQTVMYVKDIVYDHPDIVKSIIKEAPHGFRKSTSEPLQELVDSPEPSVTPSNCIMDRPRPYKREAEADHVLFASEPSLHHKRSRSSPSSVAERTIQQSRSTVTDVMETSQRPTTAADLKKLLPNDSHSMTFDEKLSLLFPAPPGVLCTHSRRSSVPSLPRIPSSILIGDSFSKMLTDQEMQDNRTSRRTTISFGSQIHNDDDITPIAETPIVNEHGIYRFSAHTYRNLAGSPRNSLIPDLPSEVRNTDRADSTEMHSHVSDSQRQSIFTSSSSEVDRSQDDSKSVWASIHSPIPAVDVLTTQRTARKTYIRTRKDPGSVRETVNPKLINYSPETIEDESRVIFDGDGLTFGMDDFTSSPDNMRSFSLNPSPVGPEIKGFSTPRNDAWHKRIGDELPAFSQRRKHLRSRAMPPPTPLLLDSNRRQGPVIILEPVVDEEEDSPETVLKKIQAQLSRFDSTSRESPDLSMHPTLQDALKSSTPIEHDKLDLIANLEDEMSNQETIWMQMQHNFDRDSNSTIIMTPQVVESTPRILPSTPPESPRKPSRSVSRRPPIGGKNCEGGTANSIHSPNITRAIIWQQRLAEAEMEFKENATAMLAAGNINFLSISKENLGSPTPPESVDSESDPETDIEHDVDEDNHEMGLIRVALSTEMQIKSLWEPKGCISGVGAGPLWSLSSFSAALTDSSEPATKSLRAVRRRDEHILPILSSKLWSKPTPQSIQSPVGLWGSRTIRPKTMIARPKAQKPQRKSKRVSFLPDIIENPSPLPHKRDTLGIFQFPWGEKSDSAVYKPVSLSNRALHNSSASSFNPEQNQVQPDFEPAEYSSSFFDDYEDDYEGVSEGNSDDDFDESTLWEIATLLNSQDVPSRDSLFPCPRIIEDYDDSDDSEPDSDGRIGILNQSTRTSEWSETVGFIPVHHLKPLPPLPLLQKSDEYEQRHATMDRGVQHVTVPAWQTFLPALDEAVRGKPCESLIYKRPSKSDAEVEVCWDQAIRAVSSHPVEKAVALWSQKSGTTISSLPTSASGKSKELSETMLWTAKKPLPVQYFIGLFTPGIRSKDIGTSQQFSTVPTTSRKPRVDIKPLATLSSHQLWSPVKNPSSECHWIFLSSDHARSTCLCSASSSGRLSPSSEESVTSVATNVSSSVGVENIMEDAERRDNNVIPTIILPSTGNEKPTVVEQLSNDIASVRRSSVLALRDLWELSTPVKDGVAIPRTTRLSRIVVPDIFKESGLEAKTWSAKIEDNGTLLGAIRSIPENEFAVQNPVFLTSPMVSGAELTNPVATGYVVQAATDLRQTKEPWQLWFSASPIVSQVPRRVQLWSKLASEDDSPCSIAQPTIESPAIHKASMKFSTSYKQSSRDVEFAKLESTELWRPVRGQSKDPEDWLRSRKATKVDFRR